MDREIIKSIVNKFDKMDTHPKVIVPNILDITAKFTKDPKSSIESIDEVKNFPPEMRLKKLIELGILTNINGYEWGCLGGDRFFVFANIKGVPVPIYKTSARTEGKRKDVDFYPFFGAQTTYQNWLIKGHVSESNSFYGIQELEEISKILTGIFDFDTDRSKKVSNPDFKQGVSSPWEKTIDGESFVPQGKEIRDAEQLNLILGKEFDVDFDLVNKMPPGSNQAVKYVSEKIFKKINKNK